MSGLSIGFLFVYLSVFYRKEISPYFYMTRIHMKAKKNCMNKVVENKVLEDDYTYFGTQNFSFIN